MRYSSLRAAVAGAALLLCALALLAPGARAQDTPSSGGAAKPEKPLAVVKLDIEETLDGKPNKNTPSILNIRKKLRDLGFHVYTEKALYADEYARKKREKVGAQPGAPTGTAAAPAESEEDKRLPPDLVITGKVLVKLDRTSTFFGGNVAFMYKSEADLELADKGGKALASIAEKDEWGKTKEDVAREDSIRRMRAYAALAVLTCEPIQARLTEKGKARVNEYAAEVADKYPRAQPSDEGGGAGEGEGQEKKQ
jgi:hypothetical protein